jgi:DNA-binding protein H-NS
MAKLTVNEIKKQIAALEAKAARLAQEETKASVAKVRALMNQLGVTLEHLSSTVGRKSAAVKRALVGSKPKTVQRGGKGVVKYRDPQTGATWTGFGRAPAWIAGAANRDAFLVSKGVEGAVQTGRSAPATKKRAAKRATAKQAAAKNAVGKKAAVKKVSAKKAAKTPAKRDAAKKAAASKAAAPASPKRTPSIKAAATKAAAGKATKNAASARSVETSVAADSSQTSAT